MSKAILVIEMPESCRHCLVGKLDVSHLETSVRCPTGNCTYDDEVDSIPSWCPLKEVPEEEEKIDYYDPIGFKKDWGKELI